MVLTFILRIYIFSCWSVLSAWSSHVMHLFVLQRDGLKLSRSCCVTWTVILISIARVSLLTPVNYGKACQRSLALIFNEIKEEEIKVHEKTFHPRRNVMNRLTAEGDWLDFHWQCGQMPSKEAVSGQKTKSVPITFWVTLCFLIMLSVLVIIYHWKPSLQCMNV